MQKNTDHILIHVMPLITRDELIQGLRQQLQRAENIVNVWLIFDGCTCKFTPEELRNKHIEDKMQ